MDDNLVGNPHDSKYNELIQLMYGGSYVIHHTQFETA